MCFFATGYWLKDKEKTLVFLLSLFFYGFVVVVYSVGWIHDFPYLYMHANIIANRSSYLLFFPTALAGIIVTNVIFRLLCEFMRFRVLEYIGKNSMNFYVTHWILFVFVTFVAKYFFSIESPVLLFTILLVVSITILPIIAMIPNLLKGKSRFLFKL